MRLELPEQVPTAAAIAAVQHIIGHAHDGLDPLDHFLGSLVDQLGLVDQADLDRLTAESGVTQQDLGSTTPT